MHRLWMRLTIPSRVRTPPCVRKPWWIGVFSGFHHARWDHVPRQAGIYRVTPPTMSL